jgi:hypothetical protein
MAFDDNTILCYMGCLVVVVAYVFFTPQDGWQGAIKGKKKKTTGAEQDLKNPLIPEPCGL